MHAGDQTLFIKRSASNCWTSKLFIHKMFLKKSIPLGSFKTRQKLWIYKQPHEVNNSGHTFSLLLEKKLPTHTPPWEKVLLTCFFPSQREPQRETKQSSDDHQHKSEQMAHQPKMTHVQECNEQNWNDQYQVGHICYHPRQIKIHLKQENNNN